jgi:hypothetical protein
MGGNVVDVSGKALHQLNVFVFADRLPLVLNGPFGEGTGASEIAPLQGQKYAFTFFGLGKADAFTLEHEFAHHFIGNALGQTNFLKNTFIDFYINYIVLPHIGRYGDVMRDYSQRILNP